MKNEKKYLKDWSKFNMLLLFYFVCEFFFKQSELNNLSKSKQYAVDIYIYIRFSNSIDFSLTRFVLILPIHLNFR